MALESARENIYFEKGKGGKGVYHLYTEIFGRIAQPHSGAFIGYRNMLLSDERFKEEIQREMELSGLNLVSVVDVLVKSLEKGVFNMFVVD